MRRPFSRVGPFGGWFVVAGVVVTVGVSGDGGGVLCRPFSGVGPFGGRFVVTGVVIAVAGVVIAVAGVVVAVAGLVFAAAAVGGRFVFVVFVIAGHVVLPLGRSSSLPGGVWEGCGTGIGGGGCA